MRHIFILMLLAWLCGYFILLALPIKNKAGWMIVWGCVYIAAIIVADAIAT